MASCSKRKLSRREFLKLSAFGGISALLTGCGNNEFMFSGGKAVRPNILFCIADDWGWPHAGGVW